MIRSILICAMLQFADDVISPVGGDDGVGNATETGNGDDAGSAISEVSIPHSYRSDISGDIDVYDDEIIPDEIILEPQLATIHSIAFKKQEKGSRRNFTGTRNGKCYEIYQKCTP